MPFDDPAALDLVSLFRDARMFESRASWAAAGFEVLNRQNNGKIMVARHPSARGLLFKKYVDEISQDDQRRNYERRLEGAGRLRSYVANHGLSHVVVPRKWIVELPRAVSRKEPSHVLVVEQIDLLDEEQTRAAYQQIELPVLRDLCTVLFHFRGMDSNGKNLPFTVDGRIALVDTEHWDRSTRKDYLHQVGEYLSRRSRAAAEAMLDQLEDGDDPTLDVGDFDDEEDTSSSSSS